MEAGSQCEYLLEVHMSKVCHAAQAAADAMLAAVQRTVLAAGQALGRTAEAVAGCRGATNSALSAQSAALSTFQQHFATSMAQDQVQPSRQIYPFPVGQLVACSQLVCAFWSVHSMLIPKTAK